MMMYQNLFKTEEQKGSGHRTQVLAAAGSLIGLLVVLCTQICPFCGFFNPISAFAAISRGLLFWAFCCTAIALTAKNSHRAALEVLCFLVPMILITGLAARFIDSSWIDRELVVCRIAALLPAAGAGAVIRTVRHSQTMAWLSIPFASLMFWFDAAAVLNGELLPLVTEFLMLAGFAWMVLHAGHVSIAQKKHTAWG